MIEVKSLRIGILLNLGKIVQPQSVYKIDYEISKGYLINGVEAEHFLPIELTEQWLKDFGFEKRHDELVLHVDFKDGIYPNATMVFIFANDKVYLEVGSDEYRIAEIKYVHQLQNIHFALTGKELKY